MPYDLFVSYCRQVSPLWRRKRQSEIHTIRYGVNTA